MSAFAVANDHTHVVLYSDQGSGCGSWVSGKRRLADTRASPLSILLRLSEGSDFAQKVVVLASRPFPFFHARCAISGKANREHILGNGAIVGQVSIMLARLSRCMFVFGKAATGGYARRSGPANERVPLRRCGTNYPTRPWSTCKAKPDTPGSPNSGHSSRLGTW